MDFDTVENWGVEKTASDLDKSLFGALNGITGNKKKTKKRKLKTDQVIDYSSPIKKSKTETSLDNFSELDSVIHDTDDKNLSKNRKKRLKDKQRKLMKKNQKMQKKDDEKISCSSMQNDYIDNKFTNKKLDRKENKSIKKKNKKSKHDQDAGNKGKEVFKENQIVIGEKDKNKGSLNKKEKVKNRTNNKSFSKLEKVKNMQGLSCDIKKVKADAKSHVENPSGKDNEGQVSENLITKTKKKKKCGKKTAFNETLNSNPEIQSCEDSSNTSKKFTEVKKTDSEKLHKSNFSQNHSTTKSVQKGRKSFNINELKSVLLKDTLDKSLSESGQSKDGKLKSQKYKKSRNENDHRKQVKGKRVESAEEDKHENQVKGKKIAASLKERMTEQLKSARFRYLNEKLYTQSSQSAYEMFQDDKEAFQVYHDGFQGQVSKWPANPVDVIIKYIKSKPKQLVVADFGCGDAKISQSVPNKVYSFDLVAVNKHVTVCDMSKVPLKDSSIDIAVFCLSLMGTNLNDYLSEASRVLKKGGTLKIAEVTSRFQSTSIARFIIGVEQYGFQFLQKDTTNKMFVMMDFKKTKPPKASPTELHLDPCVYKKR